MARWAVEPILDRIEKRTIRIPECSCWFWDGAHNKYGYAQMTVCAGTRKVQKTRTVHRLAYEAIHKTTAGLDLDHKCRNRGCINPSHLREVSRRENLLASPIVSPVLCVHGHNAWTFYSKLGKYGKRVCMECNRLKLAARRAAKSGARQ